MKKLTIKRMIALLLALVLCVGAIPLASIRASAATSWPSLSDSSYCEFTATKTIYVYRDMSFSVRGTCIPSRSYNAYIEAGDVCMIYYITANAILVGYPIGGGSYRVGYIKRSDLFGVSAPTSCVTAKGKATTYITPGGSSYGYTEAGDKVYVCGTSGNYTLIIYTAKSNNRGFKLAYVKTSDYTSKIAPYNAGGGSSAQVKLKVPLYKQYDSRWSGKYIGSKTIGQVGCTTTCIAMVYSYNTGTTVYPDSMVSKLRYANNDLYWSSISNVGLTSVSYNCGLTNTMMANIYSKLKAGCPVIIGAYTSGGSYQHWVVITGYTGNSTSTFSPSDFIVNDPGSQGATTLAAFLANGSRTDRTVIIRIMY